MSDSATDPAGELRVVFAPNPDKSKEREHEELSMAVLRACAENEVRNVTRSRLVSMWIGDTTGRYLASRCVQQVASRAIASTAVNTLNNVVQRGANYGAGQVEAMRRLVLQLPIKNRYMRQLVDGLTCDMGCEELMCLAQKGWCGNANAALHGGVVVAMSSAVASQSIDIGYYMCGGYTSHELHQRTASNVCSAVLGLGSGAVGAAIGTLVLPGIGSSVGAFLGGFVGGVAGDSIARRYIVPSTHSFTLVDRKDLEENANWTLVDVVENDISLEEVHLPDDVVKEASSILELPRLNDDEESVLYLEFDVTEVIVIVHQAHVNIIENFIQ